MRFIDHHLLLPEIRAILDEGGVVDVVIPVDFACLISMDLEGLNNFADEFILGNSNFTLSDISYQAVAAITLRDGGEPYIGGDVYVRVRAQVEVV